VGTPHSAPGLSCHLVLRVEFARVEVILVPHFIRAVLFFQLCEVAGIVLESLDQKTQVFLTLFVFLWYFFEHAHKLFGEMCVRF
jgi:hypothetical protein